MPRIATRRGTISIRCSVTMVIHWIACPTLPERLRPSCYERWNYNQPPSPTCTALACFKHISELIVRLLNCDIVTSGNASECEVPAASRPTRTSFFLNKMKASSQTKPEHYVNGKTISSSFSTIHQTQAPPNSTTAEKCPCEVDYGCIGDDIAHSLTFSLWFLRNPDKYDTGNQQKRNTSSICASIHKLKLDVYRYRRQSSKPLHPFTKNSETGPG